jgi:hypothetical protein
MSSIQQPEQAVFLITLSHPGFLGHEPRLDVNVEDFRRKVRINDRHSR